jgi:tetrapyrrole methylase family protein/MazG family protein
MSTKGITLLGLGPGSPGLLTRQAWEVLSEAGEVYLRTRHHPVVPDLPGNLIINDFDYLYETGQSFEEVYKEIADRIIELGMRPQGVIFAVPGHPLVAEAACHEIIHRAEQAGIPLRVVEGLSFLEPIFTALKVDPLPGMAVVDALQLAALHVPNFPPDQPAILAQIHSREIATEVKLTLMANYPDEYPVCLVHAAGTPSVQVEKLALYEIDRSTQIGLLSALYVPANSSARVFEAFQEVIAHLRAPNGCPWDRKQTHQTLRDQLIEEAYELLNALDNDHPQEIREELGDLLLHIVMHAQIGTEYGEFDMGDILEGIYTKIVSRHPHVFGDAEISDEDEVLENWERLKARERSQTGKNEASLLDSIAMALPALIQAEQYQERVARVGFDWPDVTGVFAKVSEELEEVQAESTVERRAEELGDLLFAAVNLARWCKVDAESALREANQRFRRRFNFIENSARSTGREINTMSPDELNELWEAAKNG